jgi:CheY-like chemotaxis protein
MTKILIVEDNEINRDMLERRLSRSGYQVVCGIDGPDGVRNALSHLPDIILMDIALGDMDGWEAIQLIKADCRTAAVPIIVLTAHALETDRRRSVEMGCADFDTKPVDYQRLMGKIQRHLAKKAA